jgi:hypothetical protein
VERAVAGAIRVAQAAGELDPVHGGATALARANAARVDEAEQRHDVWAAAAASRELRESLASIGLDRASRGELIRADDAGGDILAAFAALDAAAAGDPAQP